jgi:multisubunit Na+/H+ antiporter MnhE subunit
LFLIGKPKCYTQFMYSSFLQTFTSVDFLVGIILGIILLLVIREIMTWYWKINSIVNMLQRIELTLETIEHVLKKIETKPKEK